MCLEGLPVPVLTGLTGLEFWPPLIELAFALGGSPVCCVSSCPFLAPVFLEPVFLGPVFGPTLETGVLLICGRFHNHPCLKADKWVLDAVGRFQSNHYGPSSLRPLGVKANSLDRATLGRLYAIFFSFLRVRYLLSRFG